MAVKPRGDAEAIQHLSEIAHRSRKDAADLLQFAEKAAAKLINNAKEAERIVLRLQQRL